MQCQQTPRWKAKHKAEAKCIQHKLNQDNAKEKIWKSYIEGHFADSSIWYFLVMQCLDEQWTETMYVS